MNPPSFDLAERYEQGGDSYSWRLKDNEIRFRGTGQYAGLVGRRIPANDKQITWRNSGLRAARCVELARRQATQRVA